MCTNYVINFKILIDIHKFKNAEIQIYFLKTMELQLNLSNYLHNFS